MTVRISPNIKKESVRINLNGDEIDPRTKQVIKPIEPPYVPPVVTQPKESAMNDKIEKLIEDKINKLVEDKINKILEKLL